MRLPVLVSLAILIPKTLYLDPLNTKKVIRVHSETIWQLNELLSIQKFRNHFCPESRSNLCHSSLYVSYNFWGSLPYISFFSRNRLGTEIQINLFYLQDKMHWTFFLWSSWAWSNFQPNYWSWGLNLNFEVNYLMKLSNFILHKN